MKHKAFLVIIALLLTSASVHAQAFDYVQNPSIGYVKTFQGGLFDKIDDNNAQRTGYLYLHTVARNRFCPGGVMNSTTTTTITTSGSKNAGNCNNMTDVDVSAYVDNPTYYLTPYARLGDYDKVNEHMSVVPFTYNVWMSTKSPATNNQVLCQQNRDSTMRAGNTGYAFIPKSCSPESLLSYNTFYVQNKKGVCSDEVLGALNPLYKNNYYTHPEDLSIPGFGYLDNTNCKSVMFPENSGLRDRVNSLYNDNPSLFNSVFYDDAYQYEAYPFYFASIEYDCFKGNGQLLSSGSTSDLGTYAVPSYTDNGDTVSYDAVQKPAYPAGKQSYAWSSVSGFSIGTPESYFQSPQNNYHGISTNPTEVNEMHMSFSCPAGTVYYGVTYVLKKNPNYRHASPVDYTYHWDNIFDVPVASKFTSGVNSLSDKKSDYLVFSQMGAYSLGTVPNTNVVTQNDMNNTMKENTTTTTTSTISHPVECFACQQNNTIGNTTLNPSGGNTGGGSVIRNGADDSAVSDLIKQATNQEQQAAKQNFIDKLVQIGTALMVLIVIFYSIFALLMFVFFIFAIFGIPQRMKNTLSELFNAGVRK